MSDPLKPFAPNSLGPLQLFQRQFLLLFFLLWWRSISSLPLLFSNILCNFLSIFVPRPVIVIKLNQKYLEFPKKAFWNLLRSQIHYQRIRWLGAGNDEMYECRRLLLGKIILHHDRTALKFNTILLADARSGIIMLLNRINEVVRPPETSVLNPILPSNVGISQSRIWLEFTVPS